MEKKKFPERAAEMEMGLGLHLKGVLPYVRTELHQPGNKKRNHKWV